MQDLSSVPRRILRRLRPEQTAPLAVFPKTARQSRARRVAALTMAYDSPVLLDKWVRHYGDLLGRENLFILSHGISSAQQEVAAGCNYLTVPRDSINDIGEVKAVLLSNMSATLLGAYQAVVCGDVDELIVLDPGLSAGSFSDYILELPDDSVVAPLGFDVIPEAGYFDGDQRSTIAEPLLRQVNRAIFDWEFCKPSILKRPVRLSIGQHGVIGGRFSLDTNLVLIHLKFLALNPPTFYGNISKEVAEVAKVDRRVGNEFWAEGLARMKEHTASLGDPGAAIATLEPREASLGCYSFNQSRMPPGAGIGNAYRVVPEKPAQVFALPERWLDLV